MKNEVKELKKMKSTVRSAAKIFKYLSIGILRPVNLIGMQRQSEDFACNLLIPFCEAIEHESNCYATYNLYPKYTKGLNDRIDYRSAHSSDFCIIMQGPLKLENDFTLESVRIYRRLFPGVLIVVSTWEDEPKKYIEKLKREENCYVILNQYPKCAGKAHINYQALSSLAGVRFAKEKKIKYVLKTRSDTRLTVSGVLDMLKDYIERYPLNDKVKDKQNKRIVLFNVYLFNPYRESSFFAFGETNDLEQMYDKPMNYGSPDPDEANYRVVNKWTYRDAFNNMDGENEFLIEYFKKINGCVHCQLTEWWDIIGDYIIALPMYVLKVIWLKYDYNHEESNIYYLYRRNILGGIGAENTVVDFSMWNDLAKHQFQLNPKEFEKYIDVPLS